jgi:hypothetical protein
MPFATAQEHPRIQRLNRLFGWMGLGVQTAVLCIPFLLSLAGVYVVDANAWEGVFYVWYVWLAFPVVTVFIAWLFVRAGAFRSGGSAWWGLLASCGTLVLWVTVFACHLEGIGLGSRGRGPH